MTLFDSSSSSSSIQALALFRAALAINNCGVSLLEQGHVRDAQKTFREALVLMKQASCNPTDAAACEGIAETLHVASARLVRAQNSPVHAVVFEICAMEDGDDDQLSRITASLQYGPSLSIFFPIRIRSTTAVQDDNIQQNLEMKRHMAVLLYNQGLSHLLWGQCAVMSQTTLQQKHYSTALSCLHVAQAVLSQHCLAALGHYRKAQQQQQDADPFQKQCALIVQALVVTSLVQVIQVQNRLGLCPLKGSRECCRAPTCSMSQISLEEWIQVQRNVLKECDYMDKRRQAVLLVTSHPAATAA